MEPATIAAAYATETAVEGAVVGATIVAQPTAPLHARCTKIANPSSELTARAGHSISIIKGKAYIFGGRTATGEPDNAMHIVTLPTDAALGDTDYQKIPPSETSPSPRQGHAVASIGERIILFGGTKLGGQDTEIECLNEGGAVHVFDTNTHEWTTLKPIVTEAPAETMKMPTPRYGASATSSVHPLPNHHGEDFTNRADGKTENEFTESTVPGSAPQGTFIIHGGHDSSGKVMADVWAYDILANTWSPWPDVPSDEGEPSAAGLIQCVDNGVYAYTSGNDSGEGASKVYFLELVKNILNDQSGQGEIAITPKQSGELGKETESGWLHIGGGSAEEKVEEKMKGIRAIPGRRGGSTLQFVTTGQGRNFLVVPFGAKSTTESWDDVWTFQLPPEKGFNGARLKDRIRQLFGQKTGEGTWAKVAIVESTKEDGPLDLPGSLSNFAAAEAGDWEKGSIVIWGGEAKGGQLSGDGWIMSFE